MPHILMPRADCPYLTVDEAETRIRAAFPDAEISREQGAEHIRSVLHELLDLKESGMPVPEEEIEKLRKAQDSASYVTIFAAGEDHRATQAREIDFALVPDDGIILGYDDEAHQERVGDLVEALAEILDYEVEEV